MLSKTFLWCHCVYVFKNIFYVSIAENQHITCLTFAINKKIKVHVLRQILQLIKLNVNYVFISIEYSVIYRPWLRTVLSLAYFCQINNIFPFIIKTYS